MGAPPPPPVVYGHTSVNGFVFFDLNHNGVFDIDEVGLSGWQLQISGPVSQTVTTDGTGAYSFTGLTPGNYTVCVVAPAGWTQISPTGSPACATGIGYSMTAPALIGDVSFDGYNFGWVSQ